jgi:hypothetical protein
VQVKVADLDRNGSKQVLTMVPIDGLYAFNGLTGTLLWHRPALQGWAFTVADIDPSPGNEIIVPLLDGHLAVADASGSNTIRTKDLSQFGVMTSVETADLDGDGVAEIILSTQAGLVILSSDTLDVLWGGFLLNLYSYGNQIVVADVDGDSTPEIVAPSAHSLRVFEYRPNKADTVPPLLGNAAIRAAASPAGCCRAAFEWDAVADTASMPVTYRVYKSLVPGFTPDASSRVAALAETSFADRSLLQGSTTYYAVTAVDSAGNESKDTLRISAVAPRACPARRHAAKP